MTTATAHVVVVTSDNGDPEVWGPFFDYQAAKATEQRLRAKYWDDEGDDDSVTAIDIILLKNPR
jgi:hypothetical protein